MSKKTNNALMGIINSIKEYSDIQAERSKIMGDILANSIKSKQNWLYKMKEMQYKKQLENENNQAFLNIFNRQQGQDYGYAPYSDPSGARYPGGYSSMAGEGLDEQALSSPQVRVNSPGKFSMYYPSAKEVMWARIQAKKRKNMTLTPQEEAFENSYLGIKEGKETNTFRQDTQDAVSGKITWADLARKYPDRNIDAIKERMEGYNPVEKSPDFTEGTGSIISRIRSKFSRNQAELGDKEKNIIAQIKTENDIDELIERKDEAKAKGIDVDAILEYFGRR